MQNSIRILFITCTLSLFFSCRKDKAPETEVQIRVQNGTSAVFYNCIVNPSDGSLGSNTAYNYGQVNIDSSTAYHPFSKAYRYAAITLTMNNSAYSFQPYDYVGESPLASGNYTYCITYTNTQLNIILIKD